MKRDPDPRKATLRYLVHKYKRQMMEFAEKNSIEEGITDAAYQAELERIVTDENDRKLLSSLGALQWVDAFKHASRRHPTKRQMSMFGSAEEVRERFRNTLVEVGGDDDENDDDDESNESHQAKTVAAINVKVQYVRDRVVRSEKNRDRVIAAHGETVEFASEQIALMMGGLDYVESIVTIWERDQKRPDAGEPV